MKERSNHFTLLKRKSFDIFQQIPVSWSNNRLHNIPIQANNGVGNSQPTNYITPTQCQQIQMKNDLNQTQFVQRPTGMNYVYKVQDLNRMNEMHIPEMSQIHFSRQYPDVNRIQIVQQTSGGNQMPSSRQSPEMNEIQVVRQSPDTNQYQIVQRNVVTNKAQIGRKSIEGTKIKILRQSPGINPVQMVKLSQIGNNPIQFSRHSPELNQVSISRLSPGLNHSEMSAQPPATSQDLMTQQPQIGYQIAQQSQMQLDRKSPKIIVISPNYLEKQMQSVQVVIPKKKITNAQNGENTNPKKELQKVKPIAIVSNSRVQKPKKVQLRIVKMNAPKLLTSVTPKLPTFDIPKPLTSVAPKLPILEKVSPTRVDIKPENSNDLDREAQLQFMPHSGSQCTASVKNPINQSLISCQKNERVLFDNYGQFFIDRPCFEEALNINITVEDDETFWANIANAS